MASFDSKTDVAERIREQTAQYLAGRLGTQLKEAQERFATFQLVWSKEQNETRHDIRDLIDFILSTASTELTERVADIVGRYEELRIVEATERKESAAAGMQEVAVLPNGSIIALDLGGNQLMKL